MRSKIEKMKSLFYFLKAHKTASLFIFLLLLGAGYYGYQKFFTDSSQPRHVLTKVKKGLFTSSITGSGQVSASSQADIKPKVSGEVKNIYVRNGQWVEVGTVILDLDTRNAEKAVRDSEVNLESAKLNLEKLKKPADSLSLLQADNGLKAARESKEKAEADLKKSYDDGFNTVANVFLDLPGIMTGLHDVLYNNDLNPGQDNLSYYADSVKTHDEKVIQYKDTANNSYQISRRAYDKNFIDYKTTSRYSTGIILELLLNETYETTKSVAETIKSANNLIQFYKDKFSERGLKSDPKADTALSNLNTYTSKINAHLLGLLSIKNGIENSKDSILSADRTISEKVETLQKLKSGSDELDIQSALLTVKQRENTLLDNKENLNDYFVRAPFSGIIAKFNVKGGDSVSPALVLTSLITRQKIAEVSLNEVDVAKIKLGQKTVLTFDAVPDLNINGRVSEIDTLGTASQGVVTYIVKMIFDTQDERIKSGMSVSATIITEEKPDTIFLPNSAVKTRGEINYVELMEGDKVSVKTQIVEVGLMSDEFMEIISGLKEGDLVVVRTVSTQPTEVTSERQPTTFRVPGLSSGGGANRFRTQGSFGR